MKRWLFALAVAGTVTTLGHAQGPGPFGPDEGGATLKQPWQDAPTKKAPAPLQGLWNQAPGMPAPIPSAPAVAAPDINEDIAVKPDLGPWMILIHSYEGPDAPARARQMAYELRNAHKLNAFVFNYVAEAKRKEMERVRVEVEKQRAFAVQHGLPLADEKIRVRSVRIKDQCGVLVGGYADEAAARRALADVKRLSPPNPEKVLLDTLAYAKEDAKAGKVQDGERVYVNPFTRALVAPNPTVKRDRPAEGDKLDVAALRKMNSEEPYSVFGCNKSYTLVVKEFAIPGMLQDRNMSKGNALLAMVGLGKGDYSDASAQNAHALADILRKQKLEAYVLHTKYSSLVTIGGFDGENDPNLRSMQNLWESRLRAESPTQLQLFPRPVPMPIPR